MRQMKYKCYIKYILKKIARGLGDPSDGLHDPPLKELTGTLKEDYLLYQGLHYIEVCNIEVTMW